MQIACSLISIIAATSNTYACFRGRLAGDNLDVRSSMTVAQAREHCDGLYRCAGFTTSKGYPSACNNAATVLSDVLFKDIWGAERPDLNTSWSNWANIPTPSPSPCQMPAALNAKEQLLGPTDGDQPQWLEVIKDWRKGCLQYINFNGSIYGVEALKWTQTTYIQPQMHPYDNYFYDHVGGNYTVQRWLEDLKTRYGGIDSALVWPTYTNIGIDDRTQFNLIESMPGGVEGIKAMVSELKAAGVKVLWPYNPWDQFTMPDAQGRSDPVRLAELNEALGSDGFNGDTMSSIPEQFYTASVGARHPEAMEPEGGGDERSMNWATLGWGYWYKPFVPAVDKWKWLDTRRLTHVCDRWNKNKTDNLQAAFFNGDGFESWENVWGVWNGITGSAHKYTCTVDHRPKGEDTFWTIVNRGDVSLSGVQMELDASAFAGVTFYDCYHGVELTPTVTMLSSHSRIESGTNSSSGGSNVMSSRGTLLSLSFEMEGTGYGAVLATKTTTEKDSELAKFLGEMKEMTRIPLLQLNKNWSYLQQRVVPTPTTPLTHTFDSAALAKMVEIPRTVFNFVNKGVMVEGDDAHGVDVQWPWDLHPHRSHAQFLTVPKFLIDKYPVTIAQYSEYLGKTGYWPNRSTHNWLKNWDWSGGKPVPFSNQSQVPITYVSLEEARAYCRTQHKRLPSTWEWQLAAQGTDGRLYPWGDDDPYNPPGSARVPAFSTARTIPGAEEVGRHRYGASAFGVEDMVGNVWQYTSEVADEHTRAVVVVGGSNYRPTGSRWYFPQAPSVMQHNKYFLMDESYERAGTLGFRCAADIEGPDPFAACNAHASTAHAAGDTPAPDLCLVLQPPTARPNLTDAVDWVHWGQCSTGQCDGSPATAAKLVDRKRSSAPQISNMTLAGACDGSTLLAYTGGTVHFAWGDGDETAGPYASSKAWDVGSGIAVSCSTGGGFAFSVPAAAHDQILVVYVGLAANSSNSLSSSVRGAINVTLSAKDGVAVLAAVDANVFTTDRQSIAYHIRFSSPTAGHVLSVAWTQDPPPPVLPTPPPPPRPPAPPSPPPTPDPYHCATEENFCGFVKMPAPCDVDLTKDGSADWVHWSSATWQTEYDRKASFNATGVPLIGNFTKIGSNPVQMYNNNPVSFSWQDGAVTTGGYVRRYNDASVIYAAGKGNGFGLQVASNSSWARLDVYLGAYQATGKFTAMFQSSSGRSQVYSDSSLNNTSPNTPSVATYTLKFRGEGSITVTWVMDNGASMGNVGWGAASLECDVHTDAAYTAGDRRAVAADFTVHTSSKPGVQADHQITLQAAALYTKA